MWFEKLVPGCGSQLLNTQILNSDRASSVFCTWYLGLQGRPWLQLQSHFRRILKKYIFIVSPSHDLNFSKTSTALQLKTSSQPSVWKTWGCAATLVFARSFLLPSSTSIQQSISHLQDIPSFKSMFVAKTLVAGWTNSFKKTYFVKMGRLVPPLKTGEIWNHPPQHEAGQFPCSQARSQDGGWMAHDRPNIVDKRTLRTSWAR